jgi:hypothetical protein
LPVKVVKYTKGGNMLSEKQLTEVMELTKLGQLRGWRKGQAFFNALAMRHIKIADKIRGTDLDTFHSDKISAKTIRYLRGK